MENNILDIARAFDRGDTDQALKLLSDGDFTNAPPAARLVILAMWRRAFASQSVAQTYGPSVNFKLAPLFDQLKSTITDLDFWPLLRAYLGAEQIIGRARVTKLISSVLWDALAKAPYGFQYDALSRVFLDDTPATFLALFEHLMAKDSTFLPDYWQVQSVIRAMVERGDADVSMSIDAMVQRAGRSDLSDLVEIYVLLAGQTHADQARALALKLDNPDHKRRLADYLLGASQCGANMTNAAKLHHALSDDTAQDERAFMAARCAVNDGDWAKVLDLTETLATHAELRNEAVCLRALANANLGDHDNAAAAITHVRTNTKAKWYLKARADLINVTNRLAQDGIARPNTVPAPALSVLAGKPLAQSLWIGPRLRWIEQMSIQSYLRNGWRYQLYTYEPLENVPDGVELMDASAILPRSDIFVEGAASGIHKGSVGAFSDLFRYALLSKRGGMWTDTDVINLRRFEPDRARFISPEYSDAGLIGLNGAMMAAPTGAPLQTRALAKARHILEEGGLHFARIGPELLAEFIGEGGLQGYDLMPTNFLNPIGWMETGRLLLPFEDVSKSDALKGASNFHVYTETWRLIGLSLKEPPTGGGFLAVLFDRLMNTSARHRVPAGYAWGSGLMKLLDRITGRTKLSLAHIAADTDQPFGAYRDIAPDLDRQIARSSDIGVLATLLERVRKSGDLKWALLIGRRLNTLSPKPDITLAHARDLILAFHIEDAAALIEQLDPVQADAADLAETTFLLDLAQGKFDTIETQLAALCGIWPNRTASFETKVIERLIGAGHFDQARDIVDQKRGATPQAAHIALADVRLTKITHGPNAALQALQGLGDITPPQSEAYRTTYAALLMDWGRYNEACDIALGWITDSPRALGFYWQAMQAAAQCDRTSEVIALVDDMMARYPKFDALADVRATLAVDQNDWDLADRLYKTAHRHNQWSHAASKFSMALQRPHDMNPDVAYRDLVKDGARFDGPAIMLALFNYYYRATPENIAFSLGEIEARLSHNMGDAGYLAIYLRLLIASNRDEDARAFFDALPDGLRRCAPLAPFQMYFDSQSGRDNAATLGWRDYIADTAHMALNARASYPETIHLKYRETAGDVLLFTTFFNGCEFVDWFLDYYHALGVDHFFIVDNGSTDGTFDALAQHADVSLFRDEGSFAASACGVFWMNHLMRRFGVGHWCFHVDMDEAFVFPHSDAGRTLRDFLGYLDAHGSHSVPSIMLDIYPETLAAAASANSFATSIYIDRDYRFVRNELPPYTFIQGGLRARKSGRSLLMTKAPLVKMTPDLSYIANNHQHSHCPLSPVTSALLHYKFVGDFAGRIDEASARKEHFMGGRFYRSLKAALDTDGQTGTTLTSEHSVKYSGTAQLIDLGLIRSDTSWDDYAPLPKA